MGWNKKKGSIIFYYPLAGWQTELDRGMHRFPYSYWSLVPGLIQAGYSPQIYDGRLEEKILALDAIKRSTDIVFVGITAFTGTQLIDSMEFAKEVRAINPKIPIVWGGWHVTLSPEDSLKEDFVDIVVKGRGEETVVKVANDIYDGNYVPKVIYEQAEVHEVFPRIPWEMIDINRYGPYFSYITSTGCAWHCTFCAFQTLYHGKMFFKPMDQVIEEMKYIVDHYNGLRMFYIDDELFFIKNDRVEEFCDRWANYGRIPIIALAHVNVVSKYDDNMWKKLVKGGFANLLIGAESGNQIILNRLKKFQTPERMINFSAKAAEYGIGVTFSTMTGFLDSWELQDFRDTVLLLQKAAKLNPKFDFKMFWVRPYPGTELYNEFKEAGWRMPRTMREWISYTFRYTPSWVDRELETQVHYFLYTFWPRYGWNFMWDQFIAEWKHARSIGPIQGPPGL